ncbi:MAG: right-handed parallel beta-helix repeat-containing protein [Saprospiraceae bacterium]|nr:right-handed parallel beta-helix repeat-containing protein [Saprospiraceae bacterium]MBK9041830.1 right-handed parallel beta-helix repeat-containing protein [Saprospiraceae bacterium]
MKLINSFFCFVLILFVHQNLLGKILEVGPGKLYPTPTAAVNDVQPGDTILIFPNTYTGGYFISNLHGIENKHIYFMGTNVETVVFKGNAQSFHFSDVSYIHIENISITGQTGNGMNIDDGGTYSTPTHHMMVKNCRFYDMGAQGNNDMLKMSGVNDFLISGCSFLNGATGGSGIDMVGCHEGIITGNFFENMGSNSIQAKGGTQFITISSNFFKNGGQRSLNLGGSTGLEFFRPIDAPFEAADLDVFANVFTGSWAPIAYVGSIRVKVVNNTIINPQNWVIRILQETVDPSRFPPCGNNTFVNNIVYYSGSLSRHVNIGPNTAAQTFTFSNNLWYNHENPSVSTPQLPVTETNGLIGFNPLFNDESISDYSLREGSPAIDAGVLTNFIKDYYCNVVPQGMTTDIGAFEFESSISDVFNAELKNRFYVSPNPFHSCLTIHNIFPEQGKIIIRDIEGKLVYTNEVFSQQEIKTDLSHLRPGLYFIQNGTLFTPVLKSH